MRLFKKVAVIGVGLIGGSLALAIKRKRLAVEVIGVSRHKETILFAKKNKIIDKGSQRLSIIRGADLVILATPVSKILSLAKAISKIITSDCIVTDVGSTKQAIAAKLQRLFPKYVGSHPLAGSEKRGVINVSLAIFKNSSCIVTATKNTDRAALKKIKKLWAKLGVKVIVLSPGLHDAILSFTSHLPHAVAFSLICSVPKKYLDFSSSGLRDTTRIAASDNKLWSDIFLSNPKNIIDAIGRFQARLTRIKSAIKSKDRALLENILAEAKLRREILA